MASTKYYDGIRKAQAATKPGDTGPRFDMERMRTRSLIGRLVQGFLENPRWALKLLRRFKPIVKAGPFVLVTKAADVREVLERQEVFETPFGPEMAETTEHVAVLLGLQDGSLYRRQKSAVLSAFPPGEAETRVRAIAARHSREIVALAQPGFDAVRDLLRIVPAKICREYYGLRIDDEKAFTEWSIALSALYFGDYFGDPVVRELALEAARRMRETIDLSIDIAVEAAVSGEKCDETPLSRLVARHLADPADLTKADVRGLMFGMVSGFVPTDILASGNALDVILSKPEAQAAIEKAIGDGDDKALDRALMEAMRFKPINPGPVRYVNADTTIGGSSGNAYRVKAGQTLWVATLSAMFDESEVNEPERYNPDRPARDYAMVFGHGIHWCIGSAIARVQIAECLKALFSRKNVRRARGGAGKLRRLGPFPESLAVTFHRESKAMYEKHALVTMVSRIRDGADLGKLRGAIAAMGNPARDDIAAAFRRNGDDIHFCSVAVACRADPREEKPDDVAHLVIELSGDGRAEYCIERFAKATEAHLRPALTEFVDLKPAEAFSDFLKRSAIRVGAGPTSHAGAVFSGTPGHSVERIREEAALEREVAELVGKLAKEGLPPLETVRQVRRQIAAGPNARGLEPVRSVLEMTGPEVWQGLRHALLDPALLVAAAFLLIIGWLNYAFLFGAFSTAPAQIAGYLAGVVLGVVELVLVAALAVLSTWLMLRSKEKTDAVSAEQVDLGRYEKFAGRENAEVAGQPVMQNHLTGLSVMKPGLLRRMLLRIVFAVVAIAAKYVFRPGYLADINSIHFARWVKVPGTDRLLFFSNYGGSWESYLEDFITKAHFGLTGVWSNTLGFPRAKNLFFDGATDGDRFKRWARRQQIPTLFWYNAYPDLNTRRIRVNSAVRQGLATVDSDSAAREWLSLFGSLSRPVKTLESDEIQGLFFGPFGPLPHGRMLAIAMPKASSRAARRTWLEKLSGMLTFGDRAPKGTAVIAAFGPRGLERLGLDDGDDGLAGFPPAFRQGMNSPLRSRLLDDSGENAPAEWEWGAGENAADAIIVTYGETLQMAAKQAKAIAAASKAAGFRLVRELDLEVRTDTFGRDKKDRIGVEPFGFADGISQPVVEGTPRARETRSVAHRVAAGEFLFGYPDGRDRLPPSLDLPAQADLRGLLASTAGADGARRSDFGRNGSFLVVRQLEQNVDGFVRYCAASADALANSHPHLKATPDWVGAKMVGRWKDGSTMIRNPMQKPARAVDNDFLYGAEDPQGLHCPLGSHVRRSNPRDSLGADRETQLKLANRHRILRVGRPYKDGDKRGLLFMCLNADIERQFEFIQQTWVSAGSFHGLRSEKDPLIGRNGAGEFTIATRSGGVTLKDLPSFVRMRGGGYFFLPGKQAIAWMLSRLESC